MLLVKIFFEFHAQVQKCHFGNFSILPKWHFWTCAWNSKKILAKSILFNHYEHGNKKKYSRLVQGSAKSRIYAGKSKKRGFSNKGLTRTEIFFLFKVPMNIPKVWTAKLGEGSFFAVQNHIQDVWLLNFVAFSKKLNFTYTLTLLVWDFRQQKN